MFNNKFSIIPIILLIAVQLWFTYVTFHYPMLGINVEKNYANQWLIKGFETKIYYQDLGFRIGDIILQIDDHSPEEDFTVKMFAKVEQAEKVTVLRDGSSYILVPKGKIQILSNYFYCLFGEIISFCIAYLVYLNSANSKSGRFLSLLFLMLGIAFMSLEADARAVALSIILIHVIVMALPIVFLNFLIIFLNEKANTAFSYRFLYYLYGVIAVVMLPSMGYLAALPSVSYYYFFHSFARIYFLVGSITVLGFLLYAYFKLKFRCDQA